MYVRIPGFVASSINQVPPGKQIGKIIEMTGLAPEQKKKMVPFKGQAEVGLCRPDP
jgi:hypothetical protein